MEARIKVLTGGRSGREVPLASGPVTVGRLPEMDLQLDPDVDLDVSRRHAVFERFAGGWAVRDLGSNNGTFVNGTRAFGIVELQSGDRVQFGPAGPVVQFLSGVPQPGAVSSEPSRHTASKGGSDTGVLRAQLRVASRRSKVAIGALVLTLLVGTLGSIVLVRQNRSRWVAELSEMEQRVDSILLESGRISASLQGQSEDLATALAASEAELRSVRTRLSAADQTTDRDSAEQLRRELLAAQTALLRHQLAANVDYDAIEAANRPAVAKLFVEFPSGDRFTGSAFAVRRSGVLITSKHLVERSGVRATSIGVQFDDSPQVWSTRVVDVADNDDLALVQAERILGDVPVVGAIDPAAQALTSGTAVAVIGFPLGGANPITGSGRRQRVSALVSAGIVKDVRPGVVELDGYGAEGASGSPILGADGRLVAVLYGGQTQDGRRVLFGVTADRVQALLDKNPPR